MERIWRRQGLKVPAKQNLRGKLWLNDGSCVRLRPERPNHVWSYHFVGQSLYIEPGSPWENGYCESFNSKLRDERPDGEIFYSLKEAQIMVERWRIHCSTLKRDSSLGYRLPAPKTIRPKQTAAVTPVANPT